jgi:hypothetical protein
MSGLEGAVNDLSISGNKKYYSEELLPIIAKWEK